MNHSQTEAPITFAACWEFGTADDPGVLRFVPAEPLSAEVGAPAEMSDLMKRTKEAYDSGATTPKPLALTLRISEDAAKKRLQRLHEYIAQHEA